jgi:light-regulated signal transduction histidine kinase (bacteriophytochrome)
VDEGFEILKRDGLVRDKEVEITRKDGTSFHILINASALYDENRKFIQSRSTVLDFTEQRKSLMKIEQLNHELESFSYSVSHDLRAPLRSIDGYTQILMEDYAPKLDQEGKRLLDVVVNNARRMARLIDDLLDFSKVSRKELVKTTVNSDSLVNSILSEIRGQEPNRDIEVKIDHLSNCEADPNLLRQVWFNLLSNALKYTRRKQKAIIEISSEQNVNEVVFTIKDNGTGFDMQYSNKLFGVFQRLHRQNDFEGTGVGLAIVHRIVTRHGGRVWAKGEIDNGAVFNFSLPIM